MKLFISAFLISLTLQHCSDKTGLTNLSDCRTKVKVVDRTGLDGCGLLLEKENGELLMPIEIVPDFQLKAGQKLEIGYTEIDRMNICMAGQTVRIDCIRGISNRITCDQKGETIFPAPGEFPQFVQGDFTLQNLTFDNGLVKLGIGYSGCGPERNFKMVVDPASMKSLPPQRNVRIVFEDQPCEAFFTQTICFPVSGLAEKTILHFTDQSGERRSVTVTP